MQLEQTVKKYDTYKDSGIEWIGEIPQEWKFAKLAWCSNFVNGYAFNSENMDIDGEVPVVRIGDIQNNRVQYETCLKVDSREELKPYELKVNDIVIAMSGATTGKLAVICDDKQAYINQRVGIIRSKYNKFIRYCLDNESFMQYVALLSAGSAQPNISMGNILDYKIPYISVKEQQMIADYLDKKCGEIDRVVETEKAVIEKLKEYKQSIITEAVTKGLDKSAPLKDSGIEWIGKIPQHWEVIKLKYLSTSIGDGIHSTPNYDDSGDIYFVNGNNIGQDNLIFKEDTKKINLAEFENYNKPNLSENTIFITLNGATYGKTSFYNGEIVLLGKSAGYVTLNKEQNKKYIRYYLQSNVAKFIMDLSLSGTTIANLSLATLNDFTVTYPSLIEQQQIAEYLDKKCSEIDKAIADKEQVIEKFTEYKKSLIYECVTGKRKVC